MNINEKYMQMAIELSLKAMGKTSPNPMVGCVVVKDDKIISTGYHEYYGGYHAERNALLKLSGDEALGADLYVTLEPCCHHGKTPPCTDIIIEKGIKRVFMGAHDPNPKVDGGGIKVLGEHGIEVVTGILENECMKVNEVFMHYMNTKLPFVALKYAMTLDGKMATRTHDSKWITGEKAREHVHELRNRYSSILVGIGTVLADNPMLNCRVDGGKDPIRIICDNELRIPMTSAIVKSAKDIKTIIVSYEHDALSLGSRRKLSTDEFTIKKNTLENAGVRIIELKQKNNIHELLKVLACENIDSVFVEGGSTIHGSFFDSGYVDRVYAYVAPKIIGGDTALTVVGGMGKSRMSEAIALKDVEIMRLGDDYCITGLY